VRAVTAIAQLTGKKGASSPCRERAQRRCRICKGVANGVETLTPAVLLVLKEADIPHLKNGSDSTTSQFSMMSSIALLVGGEHPNRACPRTWGGRRMGAFGFPREHLTVINKTGEIQQ
jgi:tRNA U54 and U55 pseudouridine synthase Pus10